MKSASVFLIHSFQHIYKFRPNLHLLLRVNSIFEAASSSSSSSSLVSTDRKISTSCKTYGRSKFLEAAETTDGRISLLKEMESSSLQGNNEVAQSALIIGIHLYRLGEDPEKILYHAHKSLREFDADEPCLFVAMAMQLIGTASYALNRLDDSLRYLHRASQILDKLVAESNDDDDSDVRAVLKTVKMVRDSVENRMGEQEDAVEESLNSLETKEKTLEEDSKELGVANRSVADAFAAGFNFEAALPYALEALAIHRKEVVNNLAEVAKDRRLLGVIYGGLEEHDKAIEQKEYLLENRQDEVALLGKYEEDISEGVAKESDKDVEMRSVVLVSMSKALLVKRRKFADANKCLEFSCGVLEKKERASPVEVAEGYSEIALQYESMSEFETAVVLLEKTLCILEKLSQVEEHSKGSVSARIGWLLLLSGRVSEAVAYLESAAERLKESFGPKHLSVGYVYNLLGAAYMELQRPHQSAAQMFAAAKDIIINGGQQSPSQLFIPKFAVEFQQLVIGNWDNHGDSTKDELKEVKRFLEELRLKASRQRDSDSMITEF